MEWFEQWFGEEYLLVYEHRSCEQAENESRRVIDILGLKKGEKVLDLCCGPGRHDGPLVEHGCHVYGLDYSMPLLKLACCDVKPSNGYPQYIRGDARRLPFRDGAFDVVLNMFTSFGYFDDAGNAALIQSIARLLRPGGRFFIDYFNSPKVVANLVPETNREKDGMTIREVRTVNAETHRVEKTIYLTTDRNDQTFHESVRLYTVQEMRDMIEDAGLAISAVAGSVDLAPYSETADRMVFHGVKPA